MKCAPPGDLSVYKISAYNEECEERLQWVPMGIGCKIVGRWRRELRTTDSFL